MNDFLNGLRKLGLADGIDIFDLFEMASDWYWIMDAELRYVYFSSRVEEVTGDPAEWHYGKTREDLGIAVKAGADPLRNREAFRGSIISRVTRSGRRIWIKSNGKPLYDSAGRFVGYIGTGTDITPTQDAQDAAEHRHNLFVQAMERMTDGFALFDASDRLVFCNARFKELNPDLAPDIRFGMTFEEMVQSNLKNQRILEAVGNEAQYLQDRMHAHRHPSNAPVISRRADGQILQLREDRLDDGSSFLINSDQTQLRQREADLERAKNEAETASRAKSEFLANVSHELRTPLNAILGFSEIIKNSALDAGRYPDYAAAIHKSGQHLLSLINDLLDLNAIEDGRFEMSREPLHLRGVTASIVETVRPIARAAGVRVRATAPKDLPEVVLDRRALEQCLLNLMSNAIKFSDPGAAVTLSVAADRAGGVSLAVVDTGIGMDPQTIKSIGQPFSSNGRHVDKRGAGLGLAITKSIIEAMNGELVIHSALGRGTRAAIVFRETAAP